MVGPVFYLEMLLGGRRGRAYVFRWIYGGWLVAQLLFFYLYYAVELANNDTRMLAASHFAGSFVQVFLAQQLVLILLATPAFVAGAITDEKTRGTLQYLLTADLLPAEIVLGKLLGRLAQVAVLFLTGLPVLCFVGVFGGVDPLALLGLAAVTALPMIAVAAASVLASVWCKQTRDAVLGLYAIAGLGYLALWGVHEWHGYAASRAPAGASAPAGSGLLDQVDAGLRYFDPLYVLEPVWGWNDVGAFGGRLVGACAAWGGVALVCTALAVWRLRGAYVRQLEGGGKKKRARWWLARRKNVAGDPIRWKERQVEGIAPLVWLRGIPSWLGVLAVFVLTVAADVALVWLHLPAGMTLDRVAGMAARLDVGGLATLSTNLLPMDDAFQTQGLAVMLLASLVVGIRCSGCVSGERERQTWEALLLTPLETRQLIRGKLWGIMGASYPYLWAYAAPAILFSTLAGPKAILYTVVLLAVTWLAMFYVGAAGIWCSVKSKGSWRSLLGTLGFGYLGGFVLFVCATPFIFILALIIVMFFLILDQVLGMSTAAGAASTLFTWWTAYEAACCVGLGAIFVGMAFYFIGDATKRVSDLERTRFWKDAPVYRRRRQRTSRPRHYQ